MTSPAANTAWRERELERLDGVWESGLGEAYAAYLPAATAAANGNGETVALAAGLVEVALHLQRLGAGAAPAADLLRGDLALARASRLLADTRDQVLQVAFARAIEEQSAAAAAGTSLASTRTRLLRAIESGR